MALNSFQPLYVQIYEDLKNQITNGVYPVGGLLPTERELEKIYNVSRITAQSAVNQLAQAHIVQRQPGKGTTVLKKPLQQLNTRALGIIVPGTLESYGDTLLHVLSDEAAKYGFASLLRYSNEDQQLEAACIQQLIDAPVAGILIAPLQREFYNPVLMKYVLQGFPIVILDKQMQGLDTMLVGTDHFESARQCARMILDRGHAKIGIIDYAEISNSTFVARKDGFASVYSHSHYTLKSSAICAVVQTNYISDRMDTGSVNADVERICDYITTQRPTCIIALDSYLAYLAHEAAYRLHLSIPEDISFFGFDANPGSDLHSQYSYYQQDEAEIGRTAVRMLSAAIDDHDIQEKMCYVDGKIRDLGTVKDLNDTTV
ncbi:GntR family transcriptional regulator [Lacticaseibacillus absianus]|uniref:GntR family transcriptional regulator n=1 Tax=Lacticaseibacillus absianus TaxID=2729623 RepID=UPI0015CA5402|nr:GntR family transcriptional regulator [Lacticaseibacillus absianus]